MTASVAAMPARIGTPFAQGYSGSVGSARQSQSIAAVKQDAEASDEQLFERAANGGRDELGVLIGRYQDFLYGLLLRMNNGDSHRAEDFFQDAFLHAMKAARTFDKKKAFKPWITAIALNLVRDDARKRKVRSEVTLGGGGREDEGEGFPEPADLSEGPGETAERRDEADKIKRALGRLTDLEREVVLLHFYNSMTLQETADALGSPLGTIKSRLHAALTRLGGILERGAT